MRTPQRPVFGHPTNARGLITDTEGRWLLVFPSRGRPDWRFPGGRGRPGESPFDTCVRELSEELAVTVTPVDLLVTTFTVPLRPEQQGRGRVNYLFDCGVHRASDLTITVQRSEIISAEWFPQDEAMALLHPGSRHSINLARSGRHYGEYYGTPAAPAPTGRLLHPTAQRGGGSVDS